MSCSNPCYEHCPDDGVFELWVKLSSSNNSCTIDCVCELCIKLPGSNNSRTINGVFESRIELSRADLSDRNNRRQLRSKWNSSHHHRTSKHDSGPRNRSHHPRIKRYTPLYPLPTNNLHLRRLHRLPTPKSPNIITLLLPHHLPHNHQPLQLPRNHHRHLIRDLRPRPPTSPCMQRLNPTQLRSPLHPLPHPLHHFRYPLRGRDVSMAAPRSLVRV